MAVHSLAELLAELGQPAAPQALDRLEWLAAELLRWNRTHNLTAITDPLEVREKHLLDSLTLLPLLGPARRLLDLGSGAGFPALPVKIVRPALEVVSVDAVGKKIAFQRHVARTLQLAGFTAVHGRAEDLPGTPLCGAGFDVITARALGSLPLLVRLAAPCLAPGGRLVAMKGADGEGELAAAQGELAATGFVCTERRFLQLPVSSSGRWLLVLERRT
ncbi:MAG: 16S rRNA (guanine(527)-N(7))-methyltransferase RsmG [Deltaproteobacteria bacterium]|nr:MAG: 16S rRNA (guanine(527)-N(7))-methyltransferase RsmG [Deltaproteobacteria bacterium]